MRYTVRNRMVAIYIAVAVFISSAFVWSPVRIHAVKSTAVGKSEGEWATTSPSEPSLGISDTDKSNILGLSSTDIPTGPLTVVYTFGQMRDAMEQGEDDLYLELGADILMEGNILVPIGRKVLVDGMQQYTIDQVYTHRILGSKDSHVTLKDMDITGRYNYGIIESAGADGTAVFDNVNYTGPQPYYGSGGGGTMIIKNGGTFIIKRLKSTDPGPPEEFCQNSIVIFDGGSTVIQHADEGQNTNSVFYMQNKGTQETYIKLTNEAKVTITTRNYVFYTEVGAIPFIIEDRCSLDITAGGFNRAASHLIGDIHIGKDAYFSYRQQGTPITTDAMRTMYIAGNLSVEQGGTFLYESMKGIRCTGTITLNAPKLVSFYGSDAAFFEASGTWQVNDVNAVNYWTSSALAAPSEDHSTNWPDYMWNAWNATDYDTYKIGDAFSFSGTGTGGVSAGGEIADVLGRQNGAQLRDIFKFNTTAKRVILGNLEPFEIIQVNTSAEGVFGSAVCTDIMAQYRTVDGETHQITGQKLPLLFGSAPRPKSGGELTVVANNSGLRAVVQVETQGVLELIAAPRQIYYGEHKVPANTTVYPRAYCSLQDEQGRMVVQVLDNRGDDSSPWELTIEAVQGPIEGKKQLPASALIFRTHDDKEQVLNDKAIVIHSQGKAQSEYASYQIAWGDDQGLLAKIVPGQLGPGNYATVLNWAVRTVPSAP